MSAISNDPYTGLGLGLPSKDSQSGKGDLAQNDFLKLMTTQLMNQDPFAPMENGEFLGQMAQFSTVSGIQSLQSSFETLAASLQTSRVLDASSMVGKQVLVRSEKADLVASVDAAGTPGPGVLRGAVEAPDGVNQVGVRIEAESGATLHSLLLPVSTSGLADFSWDGRLPDGSYAPSGRYRVVAEAKVDDQLTSLPVQSASRVTSVSLVDGAIQLHTEQGSISLAEVTRIMA